MNNGQSFVTSASSNDQNNRKFELPPEGTHIARCFALIDLGTQQQEYMGKPKNPARKILLYFELVNTNFVFDEKKGPQPFIVYKEYTNTLNKNKKGEISNLRKLLNAWRGQTMSDQDADAGFPLDKLIGKSCQVSISHKEKQDKTKKADITAIIQPPMQQDPKTGQMVPMPCNQLRNERVCFVIGWPNQFQEFDKLFGWVRDTIGKSPEFTEECGKIGKTPAQVSEESKQRWMAANGIQPSNPPQNTQQGAIQPNHNFVQQQQPQYQQPNQPQQQFQQQQPVQNPNGGPQQRQFNNPAQPPQNNQPPIANSPDDMAW